MKYMINVCNYILLRFYLRRIVLSHFFPLLLGMILFILYQISLDSVILCDDVSCTTACVPQELVQETLDKLKNNLSDEIKTYKEALNSYEFWREGKSRAIKEPGSTNYKLWAYLSDQSTDGLKTCNRILKNIRFIEKSIKNIDPDFNSCLEKQGYEKIVFNYTDYQN